MNYEEVIKVCNIGGKAKNRKLIVNEIGWREDYQDNGFCQGELTEENFVKAVEKAKKKKCKIFFANDYDPSFMRDELFELFEVVICPVQELRMVDENPEFKWYGFVTRKDRRYSFNDFRKRTENKRIWSMGYRSLNDYTITEFDGFDTALPSKIGSIGGVITPEGKVKTSGKTNSGREKIIASFFNLNYYLSDLWKKNYAYKRWV